MKPFVVSHDNNSDKKKLYIYHEYQINDTLLCGQNTLNNLVQYPIFSIGMLSDIAVQLNAMEEQLVKDDNDSKQQQEGVVSRFFEQQGYNPFSNNKNKNNDKAGSYHVDESGNFSIEVIKAALEQVCSLPLVHLQSETCQTYLQTYDITTISGFILHKSDHWFCIRRIYDMYWDCNSTLPYPKPIPSHFQFAKLIEHYNTQQGYTIFCILPSSASSSPTAATSANLTASTAKIGPTVSPSLSLPDATSYNITELPSPSDFGNWYTVEELLLKHNSNQSGNGDMNNNKNTAAANTTTKKVVDNPWAGTGRRLDSQDTMERLLQQPEEPQVVVGLTEEEMIQYAMEQSMMEMEQTKNVVPSINKLPEPIETDTNAIKVQFRIYYNNTKPQTMIRRFYKEDTIEHVQVYIMDQIHKHNNSQQQQSSSINRIKMMFGYPPKDMLQLPYRKEQTLEEIQIHNETVHVRFA